LCGDDRPVGVNAIPTSANGRAAQVNGDRVQHRRVGGITAETESARHVVTVQMLLDLLALGLVAGASSAAPLATMRTAPTISSWGGIFEHEAAGGGPQGVANLRFDAEGREYQHPRRRIGTQDPTHGVEA